jgi:hypothetical protein
VGGDSLALIFVEENDNQKYSEKNLIIKKLTDNLSKFFGFQKKMKIPDPESILGKFLKISLQANSVTCCRVTPLQKV